MIAGLCALAIVLALPAAGAAATVNHVRGSESGTFSICGLDLDFIYTFQATETVAPSGATLIIN
jgi:hypothetical protein